MTATEEMSTERQLPTGAIYLAVGMAVCLRGLFLLYNEILVDLPPFWGWQARASIVNALSHYGAIPIPAGHEAISQMAVEEAAATAGGMDRGLIYIHLAFISLFGTTSFLAMQAFLLVMDALLVVPAFYIANKIGGRCAGITAAFAFALFVPEIQMAATPGYNSWLTFAMLTMTALMLYLTDRIGSGYFKAAVLGFFALVLIGIASNQIRSVTALYCIAGALWLAFIACLARMSIKLDGKVWGAAAAIFFAGVLTLASGVASNKAFRGEASPVRSTLGHAFWTGVGQFENPFGVIDDDGSIAAFYKRETGRDDDGNSAGVAYNAWLQERALAFIAERPGLYASMVLRRALRIVFPNMALSFIADIPSHVRQPEQMRLIEIRKALVAEHGWVSFKTMSTLMRVDPSYLVSLAGRVAMLVLLPIGLFGALVLAPRRDIAFVAALPMAYTLVCLAPLYVTPPVVTAAHAATLPVTASGFYFLWVRLKKMLRGRRAVG